MHPDGNNPQEITGKFPGYLSPSAGLKFADVPNGLAAISKVPAAGERAKQLAPSEHQSHMYTYIYIFCLFIYLSIYLFIYLSIFPSIYLSFYLSIYLSIYLSYVFVFTDIFTYVFSTIKYVFQEHPLNTVDMFVRTLWQNDEHMISS